MGLTRSDFASILGRSPLIASVQASPTSAVDDPATLTKLAECSLANGVEILRLEGVDNIRAIRSQVNAFIIGLIKKTYNDSSVYITPTSLEVSQLVDLDVDVVALDITLRHRPGDEKPADLVHQIHMAGKLAMADCDSKESIDLAIQCGADLVSTTLSGYTENSALLVGPDLELLRYASSLPVLVLAEGRYYTAEQVQMARAIGADGVVIGGALNDPVKQTRGFLRTATVPEKVGAVDIGGTWIRYSVIDRQGNCTEVSKAPVQSLREDRMDWIRARIAETRVNRLGVSTGGIVDPKSGEVWEAKPIIPNHVGSVFSESELGLPVFALNDGLATVWGFACRPEYVGKRLAVLALGTGVGCGVCHNHRLLMGARGEYPRINDLIFEDGLTIEDRLGGAALTSSPSREAQSAAQRAFDYAIAAIEALYLPDVVIITGGVGRAEWLEIGDSPHVKRVRGLESREDGLFGAGMLALFPPHV